MRAFALGLPEAGEEFPWEESVIKVNKKVFVFLGVEEPTERWRPGFTVKLPESAGHALAVPGAERAGYNLGRAGWVWLPFTGDLPDPEVLFDWVEESYRAVAPKRLVKELDARVGGPAAD
ncbi:MmcQ/YjbR family DNA-binding protein [Bailinhaonella thermotolerans]|uniref:MmcQ/YjbR family DNA-binding protein n=1 Tax=Bailinhaonella thermotolerans TaxID=1070861 RepID=A0A3A4BIE4_9ACTN|nr:MmcQ/YjbR family DNA-binding protein [Bailinhaonella thermotolerans]